MHVGGGQVRPSLFGGLDYWTGLLDSRKMPLEDKRTEL